MSAAEVNLATESIFDAVLQELDGIDDDDTVRTRMVLESILEIVRGFQRPRAEVIAQLQTVIDEEITAGELRRRTRWALAVLASEGVT